MLAAVAKAPNVTEITVGLVVHGRVRCGKLIAQQRGTGETTPYEISSLSGEPYVYCHDAVQAAIWLVRLVETVNELPQEPVTLESPEQQVEENRKRWHRHLVYWGFLKDAQ